jgi:hypothetical protein
MLANVAKALALKEMQDDYGTLSAIELIDCLPDRVLTYTLMLVFFDDSIGCWATVGQFQCVVVSRLNRDGIDR